MTEIVGAGWARIAIGRTGAGVLTGYIGRSVHRYTNLMHLDGSATGTVKNADMRIRLTGAATGAVLTHGAGAGSIKVLARTPTNQIVTGVIVSKEAPDMETVKAFPFALDWIESFVEKRSYLTDVISATNGTEQRRMVRERARRSFEFTLTGEDAEKGARLHASLLQLIGSRIAVPAWPYVTTLSQAETPGTTALNITGIADSGFAQGCYLMLWQSESVYEFFPIDAVGGSTVTIQSGLVGTWPNGSLVVPCFVGKLATTADLNRPSRDFLRIKVAANLDPLPLPPSGGTMGSTAGLLLLGQLPTRLDDRTLAVNKSVLTMPVPSARDSQINRLRQPRTAFTYEHVVLDLSNATELWTWLDVCFGRLNASWVPTFDADLQLSTDLASGSSSVVIKACNFTSGFFPLLARRYLALYASPGSVAVKRITGSSDGGATETLTLSATAGINVSKETGYIGFAAYARLAEDEVTLDWVAPGVGRITLSFLDVPIEAPLI